MNKPVLAIRDVSGRYIGTKPRPRPVAFCECGDHAFTAIGRAMVTFVSPCDAHFIQACAWTASRKRDGSIYARRNTKRDGTPSMGLHRAILPTPATLDVDHINRNTLDNRRPNLRAASRSDNNRNRQQTNARSGLFGVTLHGASGLWRGYVNKDGRQISAGYFHTKSEAAAARDALCRELGLSFCRLNNVEQVQK